MIIELTNDHFEEIHKKGYNLDVIFILKRVENEEDLTSSSDKIANLCTLARRKGLITTEDKLTKDGEALLAFLSSEGEVKLVKKKPVEDIFLKWWETYRRTDDIFLSDKTGNPEDKSVLFSGSRGLRVKKDECKIKFNKILTEGEYTVDDMIRALSYEIKLKIKKSLETRNNCLSYMQNSLTYLNQRTYENFIDISKTAIVSKQNIPQITDI